MRPFFCTVTTLSSYLRKLTTLVSSRSQSTFNFSHQPRSHQVHPLRPFLPYTAPHLFLALSWHVTLWRRVLILAAPFALSVPVGLINKWTELQPLFWLSSFIILLYHLPMSLGRTPNYNEPVVDDFRWAQQGAMGVVGVLRLGLINILTPYRLDRFSPPKQIPTQTPSSGKSIRCPCLLLPRWVFHPCEYGTGTPWAYRDAQQSPHQRCNSSQTMKGRTHFVRRQAVSYRFQLESPFKHSNLK